MRRALLVSPDVPKIKEVGIGVLVVVLTSTTSKPFQPNNTYIFLHACNGWMWCAHVIGIIHTVAFQENRCYEKKDELVARYWPIN
jgi:hypothetical protein